MAQLLKKFIGDNQVADEKIRLDNSQFLRGRNNANSGDVNMFTVDAQDQIQAGAELDMNSNNITKTGYIDPGANDTYSVGAIGFKYQNGFFSAIDADGGVLALNGSNITVSNTFRPTADNTADVGTSTARFNDVFATRLDAVGSTLELKSTSGITVSNNVDPTADNTYSLGNDSARFQSVGALAVDADVSDLSLIGDNVLLTGASTVKVVGGANLEIEAEGLVKYFDAAGDNFVAFKAPNTLSADTTYTLPLVDGSSGQFLQTNGSGTLIWASPSGGELTNKATFTLSAGDITNQYIDLSHVAKTNSIVFFVRGGGVQQEGASYDYSVNYTGGAGGNTRITFLNDLATAGASALVAGDIVVIQYEY